MKVLENVSLSEITYYQIGGTAKYVLEITDREDVKDALLFLRKKNITSIRVVGLGSNLIIPDSSFDGAVLWLHGGGSSAERDGENVDVFAGDSVDSLIQYSFSQGLVGLEWAGGLPSTVGGSIRGNAGAFGSEIKDTVFSVETVDLSKAEYTIQTFTKEEGKFSYRNSYFKQHPNLFLVGATFQLKRGTKEELELANNIYKQNIEYRERNHPMEYPSCGSVFKNIIRKDEVEKILIVWPDARELSEQKWHNKISMGYVIKRLGFSGKRFGGAQVSEKHANYISNIDHAKAEDVKALVQQIREKVEQTFNFTPEPEVVIVSD